MSFYHTSKNSSISTSIGQDGQSKVLFLPGATLPGERPAPSKRRTLTSILKQANSAVDMRVIMDHLYEALFGKAMTARQLRIIYGLAPGESLRRAIAEHSPLYYSSLRHAEDRLGIYVEGLMEAGKNPHLGALYFAASNVGQQVALHMERFIEGMKQEVKAFDYDPMENTFNPVEDDEDHPF